MNNELISKILNKTNEQLLDEIGLGKEAYQDGIFQLYIDEANKRGLNINDDKIEEIKNLKKNKTIDHAAKTQSAIGIILFLFMGGLFAFIPGIELLSKNKFKEYKYKGKYRVFAVFLCIWSIIPWSIIIILLIKILIQFLLRSL